MDCKQGAVEDCTDPNVQSWTLNGCETVPLDQSDKTLGVSYSPIGWILRNRYRHDLV